MQNNQPLNELRYLRAVVLVLSGIIIGGGLAVYLIPKTVDEPDSVVTRWHVWEGDGRIFGDPYNSADVCEGARKAHLMGELARSNAFPKFPGQMTEDEELEKAKRAYCRSARLNCCIIPINFPTEPPSFTAVFTRTAPISGPSATGPKHFHHANGGCSSEVAACRNRHKSRRLCPPEPRPRMHRTSRKPPRTASAA